MRKNGTNPFFNITSRLVMTEVRRLSSYWKILNTHGEGGGGGVRGRDGQGIGGGRMKRKGKRRRRRKGEEEKEEQMLWMFSKETFPNRAVEGKLLYPGIWAGEQKIGQTCYGVNLILFQE